MGPAVGMVPCTSPPPTLAKSCTFDLASGPLSGLFSLQSSFRPRSPRTWRQRIGRPGAGPRGDSTSQQTGLPVTWSRETGVAWKTPLPEWGSSTPAIWDDAVFVTTQQDDNLLVLKLDRRTGAIEWTQKVGQGTTPRTGPKREKQKFHQLHNLASPSPVTDGKLVVVHFGNGDLAAYDFAGKLHWRRNLQEDYGTYTIWWGHANSPVLYRDLVISVCMQDSLADLAEKQIRQLFGGPRPGNRKRALEINAHDRCARRRGRCLYDARSGRGPVAKPN